MKTILINGVCQRVDNEVADHEVKMGRATYAPKSELKKTRSATSIEAKIADLKGEVTKNRKAEKAAKLKSKQRPAEYTDKLLR
jgi:hypothetical protein